MQVKTMWVITRAKFKLCSDWGSTVWPTGPHQLLVSCASSSYAERVREGLGNCAHPSRILRMYDASHGMYVVATNRILIAVGQLGMCTCVNSHAYVTMGMLSIIHILAVPCSELCNLTGVLKFLNRYTLDVHGSPDPLSFFLHRRG